MMMVPLNPECHGLSSLYHALFSGKRQLVAWGATGDCRYIINQFPVLPIVILDSNQAKWGSRVCDIQVVSPEFLRTLSPDDTAIMILPRDPGARTQIQEAIGKFGPFRTFLPPCVETDTELLQAAADGLDTVAAAWARQLAEPISVHLSSIERPAVQPSPIHKATLVIERLTSGGAERQICRLACGLAQAGVTSRLIVTHHKLLDTVRLEELLEKAGVPLDIFPPPGLSNSTLISAGTGYDPAAMAMIRLLPSELQHSILMTYLDLRSTQPDVVIAYMERAGIVAGIAALLAQVPQVLISLRSLDPTHFPQYFPNGLGWYKEALSCLAGIAGVRLVANSQAGAETCTRWLGLQDNPIPVIANVIPDDWELEQAAHCGARLRASWGMEPDRPVIVGVFRMVAEKQPLLFLETIKLLQERHPSLLTIMVGDGPMLPNVRQAIADNDLVSHVFLAGEQPDALPYIAAADVLLHTAAFEGMPNVHMEAQSMAKPVASFAVGGVLEALAPSLHPFTAPAGAVRLLAEKADMLLRSPDLRRQLGEESRSWVKTKFGMDRLINACIPYR